jgi:hypothetical protein
VSVISSIRLPSGHLYSLPAAQTSASVASVAEAASDASPGPAAEVSGATAKLGLKNEAVVGALIQSLLVSSQIGTFAPAAFPADSPEPQVAPQVNQVS